MSLPSQWWNKIKGFLNAEEDVSEKDFSDTVKEMKQQLEQRRKTASYQMALATDSRKELEQMVAKYEGNKQLAEQFLRDGDRAKAEHCVKMQVQASKRIAELKDRYTQLKSQADQAYSTFRQEKAEVDERLRKLPQLKHDQRVIRAQEEIQGMGESMSLSALKGEFDEAERELAIKAEQQHSLDILSADPDAAMEADIKQTLQQKEIDQAMAALEQRVQTSDATEVEYSIDNDPIAGALEVLKEEPAWISMPSQKDAEPVRVEQETEVEEEKQRETEI
jgi:phage shock protein A